MAKWKTYLSSAVIPLLVAFVITHFLPSTPLDPWGLFNPQQFGYLVLTLATVEFLGYVLVKAFGIRRGSIATGFLGGLVSSTALLFSLSKKVSADEEGKHWKTYLIAALSAKIAAVLEMLFFVVLFLERDSGLSPTAPLGRSTIHFFKMNPVLYALFLPVGLTLIILLSSLFIVHRFNPLASGDHKSFETAFASFADKPPLDWRLIFRLATTLAVILTAASAAQLVFGKEISRLTSFLTGLFELHGYSLATTVLFNQGKLTSDEATENLLIALIASLLSSGVLGLLLQKRNWRQPFSLWLFGIMILTSLSLLPFIL